jgi:Putative Actinobacterial Holin-X, holin superfamily III
MRESTRPLASVMTQVFSDVAYLLQTEIRLARAEIGEKLSRAVNGGILIGVGGVLLLPGIFVLLMAVVRWLQVAGLPEQWGLLLVGIITIAIGVALALAGAKSMKGSALVPDRAIHEVREDISLVKEHV